MGKRAATWTSSRASGATLGSWIGECPDHGKKLWPSRKAAKAGIRRFRDPAGMSVYRCDVRNGWHIGHMPQRVKTGAITRREIYG